MAEKGVLVETETVIASFEVLLASQRVGIIQTDLFCAGCGYDLFSQGVVRDPNTRILLCRCPECGKFAPAGVATIADSGWRRAAGGLLILLRALLLLFLIGLALLLMGVIPYAFAEEMVSFVTYRMGHYDSATWQQWIFFNRMSFSVGALGVGLGAGLIAVIGFYHWRKRFYYLLCLAPALALLVSVGIWKLDHPQYHLLQPTGTADTFEQFLQNDYRYTSLLRTHDSYQQQLQRTVNAADKTQWETRLANIDRQIEEERQRLQVGYRDFRPLPSPAAHLCGMALLAMVGMLLGIVIGRPVVRGLLRVLIPARALQSAAVLWFADGKVPPRGPQQVASAGHDKVRG
jgi:hypothetical protein